MRVAEEMLTAKTKGSQTLRGSSVLSVDEGVTVERTTPKLIPLLPACHSVEEEG